MIYAGINFLLNLNNFSLICNTIPEKKSRKNTEEEKSSRKVSQVSNENKELANEDNKINTQKENESLRKNSENKIEKSSNHNDNPSKDNYPIVNEDYNSNCAINNESQNKSSEKDDNTSELSSLGNHKIENTQEPKIIKKTKIKKGDLSHHIEGVIFEEVDEGEEYEANNEMNKNENLKRINSSNQIYTVQDKGNSKNNLMQELLKFRNIDIPQGNNTKNPNETNTVNSSTNTNTIANLNSNNISHSNSNESKTKIDEHKDFKSIALSRSNSANNPINQNYNLQRQESINKEKNVNDDTNSEIKEKELLSSIMEISTKNLKNKSIETSNIDYVVEKFKKEKSREIIVKEIRKKISDHNFDENEFYEISKSIKMHKTNDKEEVYKEIFAENIKNSIQKGEVIESLVTLGELNKKDKEKNNKLNKEMLEKESN